jgi:type II secretory pathway pseudopilin PulG
MTRSQHSAELDPKSGMRHCCPGATSVGDTALKTTSTRHHAVPRCGPRRQRDASRAGAILTELVVATVLISVIATVLLPLLSSVRRTNSAIEDEHLALIELGNLQVQLQQLRPENIDDLNRAVAQLTAEPWFRKLYPAATVAATLRQAAAPPNAPTVAPVQLSIEMPSRASQATRRNISVVVWISLAAEEHGA